MYYVQIPLESYSSIYRKVLFLTLSLNKLVNRIRQRVENIKFKRGDSSSVVFLLGSR